MSFFSLFKGKKKTPRRERVTQAAVSHTLLTLHRRADYQHLNQKAALALPSAMEVADVVRDAWEPWQQHAWECEDQARAVIHAAQIKAANEGCSWAIGTLRAQPPKGSDQSIRHVYVWAVIRTRPGGPLSLLIHDPTALRSVPVEAVREVDYTMT